MPGVRDTGSKRSEPGIRVLQDASRRDYRESGRPRPIRIYEWEPQSPAGTPVPLVVVSHGTGGSGGDMRWLVEPLVAAGFRVIAVDHHGNNYVGGYEPEGFLFVWERPRDLTFVLDVLADEQPHGPVGAAGFSVGGYTLAALAGARLDPQRVAAALTGRAPLPLIPEFPGVLAALRQKVSEDIISAAVNAAGADASDSRVRAAFQVAPGIGSLLTPESLRAVPIPVEIRWGGADTIMTFEENIRPYLENISSSGGRSAGPEVRHEDFFEPEPADPGDAITSRCRRSRVLPRAPHLSGPHSVEVRTVACLRAADQPGRCDRDRPSRLPGAVRLSLHLGGGDCAWTSRSLTDCSCSKACRCNNVSWSRSMRSRSTFRRAKSWYVTVPSPGIFT